MNFTVYMDTSGVNEELEILVASLLEAYICAGGVIIWRLYINNVDLQMNKKWVRSRIPKTTKVFADIIPWEICGIKIAKFLAHGRVMEGIHAYRGRNWIQLLW